MSLVQFNNIYQNKKVLVTGNTGFKGSWLSVWLLKLGAEVYGLSYGIPTEPSHFVAAGLNDKLTHFLNQDIRGLAHVKQAIEAIHPDFVFHLAAQPLVRLSYDNPALTIQTNVIGTMNILEALRRVNPPCCAVMITSDKCYDNVEWVWGYRETDALGGEDPYSASKGAAELVIKTYARSFFEREESRVKVASARAGNVIGGGDWAKDRVVPDCVRAWSKGESVQIRNPTATRPWQHVLEPLSGYLRLGQELHDAPELNGEPFNFGPPDAQNYTVGELTLEMQKNWHDAQLELAQQPADLKKREATLLKLSCDKASAMLGWQANFNFEQTVRFTMDWYRNFYQQESDVFQTTCAQIDEYVQLAAAKGFVWVSEQ
jgi:CDP-glucose 4,6-dehydratase